MSDKPKPTAHYRATRNAGEIDSYTLKFELSDDPGENILLGYSKDRCRQEMESLEKMGYELISTF